MSYELHRRDFGRILLLIAGCHFDPTVYAVIEGRKNGRIFTNSPDNPTAAFIWNNTEWAYLVGDVDNHFYEWLFQRIRIDFLPRLTDIGYLSIFTYSPSGRSRLLEICREQHPHSPAVNTFTFDAARFAQLQTRREPLPNAYEAALITPDILSLEENQHLQDDLAFYWDSINAFRQWGLGTCILHQGRIVSCCNSDAFGRDGHRINIWTARDHRRRGLAQHAGAAFVSHCLRQQQTPVYLCDEGNVASHRLAESLGFVYTGDLYTVDVPVRPFAFYKMLGSHFRDTLKQYNRAAHYFETALQIRSGDAALYYETAVSYALAQDEAKAYHYLHTAVIHGWHDWTAFEQEAAFRPYLHQPHWPALKQVSGR